MPKGPKGEKRTADVIGNAVKIMKIAMGEIEDMLDVKPGKNAADAELGRCCARQEPEKFKLRQYRKSGPFAPGASPALQSASIRSPD